MYEYISIYQYPDNIVDIECMKCLNNWLKLMNKVNIPFNSIPKVIEKELYLNFTNFSCEIQIECLKFFNLFYSTQNNCVNKLTNLLEKGSKYPIHFINSIYNLLTLSEEFYEVVYEFLSYLSLNKLYQPFLMTLDFVNCYEKYKNSSLLSKYITCIIHNCLSISSQYMLPNKLYLCSLTFFLNRSLEIQHKIIELVIKQAKNYSQDEEYCEILKKSEQYNSRDILSLIKPNITKINRNSEILLFPINSINHYSYKPIHPDNKSNRFLQLFYTNIPDYIHEILEIYPKEIYNEIFRVYEDPYIIFSEPHLISIISDNFIHELSDDDYKFLFSILTYNVSNIRPRWIISYEQFTDLCYLSNTSLSAICDCFDNLSYLDFEFNDYQNIYSNFINKLPPSSFSSLIIKNSSNYSGLTTFMHYCTDNRSLPKVTTLSLTDSNYQLEDLSPIFGMLLSLKNLTRLDLSNNKLNGYGIAECIKNIELNHLKSLNFSNNSIGEKDGLAIAEAIYDCTPSLQDLDLSNNVNLTDDALSQLFEALTYSLSLLYLDISSTGLTFENSFTGFSLFLRRNTSLIGVDISNNKIKSPKKIEKLLSANLSLHPTICHFFAENTPLSKNLLKYWKYYNMYSNIPYNHPYKNNQKIISRNNSLASPITRNVVQLTQNNKSTSKIDISFLYSRPAAFITDKMLEASPVVDIPEYDDILFNISSSLKISKEIDVKLSEANPENIFDSLLLRCEILHIFAPVFYDNDPNDYAIECESKSKPGIVFLFNFSDLSKAICIRNELPLFIITTNRIELLEPSLKNFNNVAMILLVECNIINTGDVENFFIDFYNKILNTISLEEAIQSNIYVSKIKYKLIKNSHNVNIKYFTNVREISDNYQLLFKHKHINMINPIIMYKCMLSCCNYRISTLEFDEKSNNSLANKIIESVYNYLNQRHVFDEIHYMEYQNFNVDILQSFNKNQLYIIYNIVQKDSDEIYNKCYYVTSNTLKTNIILVSNGLRDVSKCRGIEGIITL